MKKERANVPVRVLELNSGQLDWLPKNPRQWTQDDVDRTRRSIEEDPDFMDDRPLLVVPKGHKFIVFAGNLRLTACKALDWKGAPVVIYHEESEDDRDTIIRRAMKDNSSFGSWDYDTLANEWGDLPLTDWGVPAWEDHAQPSSAPAVQEDDFDEDNAEIHVRCKPGDVWELGPHRLMCGDSTDLETVKTLMGGGRS